MIRFIGIATVIGMNIAGLVGLIYLIVLAFMGSASWWTVLLAFACWIGCRIFINRISKDMLWQ